MKQQKFFLLIFFFSLTVIKAQNQSNNSLSGELNFDSNLNIAKQYKSNIVNFSLELNQKKSPLIAGLLSGILPGAGEIYSHQYLKGGIFILVEAASIATALIYTRKGNNQTVSFQNYANQNWSVAKYAAWSLQHSADINPNVIPSSYNVFPGVDWTKFNSNTNWNQYNSFVNRSELNRLESDLSGGYSHQLAEYGTQDFYEIIGKYPQFSHGWSTANFDDTDFHILTNQLLLYAHARGLANSYYTTGNTAVLVLIANHFLSIFDAIWSANTFNKSLAVNFRVNNDNLGDRYKLTPTLNLCYRF